MAKIISDEIEEIKDLNRLTQYVPHLLEIFRNPKYRRLFEDDMTENRFIARIFEFFNHPSPLFAGRIVNNRLEFFICIASPYQDLSIRLCWFAFSNPKCRDKTYKWFEYCKEVARTRGVKEVRFISNRNNKAYRYFANKVGAKLLCQTFSAKL